MVKKNIYKGEHKSVTQPNIFRSFQKSDKNIPETVLLKKIDRLQRSLAQRENEVWTLKQLLLYR
ncbi:MAG: hypothetical protein HZB59_03285 [Ignavibacteriales bacterium]|nr:hypothetical protein [Ignavibacteriales bacterium]